MTLIQKNGMWYLTTPTYSGASKDLDLLLEDARIISETIVIKGVKF